MKLIFARKSLLRTIGILGLILIGNLSSILFAGCNNSHQPQDNTLSPAAAEGIQTAKSQPVKDWRFYGKLRKKFEIEDELISKLLAQPPRSAWLESEKSFYQDIISDNEFDVMVVPFQTQSYGLDHIERMLMSYKLAVAIEQNTDLKVAPLHLIYPALGWLSRYYDEDEVYALAKKIGVSRIIWCYAGTENEPHGQTIELSYSIIDEKFPFLPEKNEIGCRKWPHIALQPDYLPFQEFDSNLDAVMKFLGIPFAQKRGVPVPDQSIDFRVPSSPSELLSPANNNTLLSSYYLQYLAMIAPTDYQKTYLFTRSITNLFQLETNGSDRKLIEARALLHLYRRPAALKIIEAVETPEIAALRQYANANLPESRKKTDLLKPSIKRFLAELELFSLRDEYNEEITEKEIDAYVKKYPDWAYFLRKHLADSDPWERSSNIELKKLLDNYLPVPHHSLEDIAAGQIVTAENLDDLRFELLFQDHIHKAIINRKEKLSNATNLSGNGLDLDFLFMAESVGLSNLIRMIEIPGFTQWLPDRGTQICNDILKSYKDHPYFTCLKFSLLYNQMEGSREIVKSNLRQEICDLAFNTMWWNGRQNWVNSTARRFLRYISKSGENPFAEENPLQPQYVFIQKKDLEECIGMDYPFRVNNVSFTLYRSKESIRPWIHTEIKTLMNQYYERISKPTRHTATDNNGERSTIDILSEIQNRFNGHPEKSKFLNFQKIMDDKTVDKKELLSDQIKKGSNDWKTYKELANLYIEEYSYDQAKAILLQYPGLVPPFQNNVVTASNIAAAAGNLFFRRGAIDYAKHFYKISAELDTGSAGCIEAQEKLALLNKDYVAASEYSLARAQRYNDPSAYASYMTYLHLQGNHTLAWSIFDSIATHFSENSEIWTSALIGHRIEGKSDKDIVSWLDEMAQIVKTDKQRSYLARFGNLSFMDRKPDKEIIGRVEKFDVQVLISYYEEKMLVTPGKSSLLPYTAFARGYDLLMKGDFEEAYNFYAKAARFSLKRPYGYFAYAAARSGSIDDFKQRYLPKSLIFRNPTHRDFDKFLAHAVIDCYSKNHSQAELNLKNAYSVRPPTIDDPNYSMYYLTEICEWLYNDSGESIYLDLLLKWCRAYQITAPMFAWPYAIEAKYSTNQNQKMRALAIAQYLDPHSLRIAEFDQEMKDNAKKWLKANNPFSADPPKTKGV